jgi:hypothetical protein
MANSDHTEGASPEPGYLLGFASIGLLAFLLIAALLAGVETGPIRPGAGTVLLGLYVMAWGLMFLASYFYSHKSFFFRALIWVCERFSFPASRKMALFYFVLAFAVGGAATLAGFGLL